MALSSSYFFLEGEFKDTSRFEFVRFSVLRYLKCCLSRDWCEREGDGDGDGDGDGKWEVGKEKLSFKLCCVMCINGLIVGV